MEGGCKTWAIQRDIKKTKASPWHSLLTPLKKIQTTFPVLRSPYHLFSADDNLQE